MNLFDRAFKFTEENEGGFVNDKRDKGGATIAGISSKWFPNDFQAVMNAPTKEEQEKLVKSFYQREFWNPLYEQLRDSKLAIRLFDLTVNMGKVTAIKLLQKSLSITADGKFGKGTLGIANSNPDAYQKLIDKADAYYKSLPDFKVFGKGWLNRLYKAIS
jgi:lysozyme family protein